MTWREAELLLQQPRKPTTPTGPSREALRTMLNAHQYTRAPNGSIHPHASAGASGSGDSQPPAGTDPSAPRDPQPLPPQPPQHTGDKAAAPAIDAHKQRMADNPYTGAQGRPQQTRKPDSHPAATDSRASRATADTACTAAARGDRKGPALAQDKGQQRGDQTQRTGTGADDGPQPAAATPSRPETSQPPPHPSQQTGDKATAAAKDAHRQRTADNPYTRTQEGPQQPQQAGSRPAAEAHGAARTQRAGTASAAHTAATRDTQTRPPPARERGQQHDNQTQRTTTDADDQPEIPQVLRWPTPPYKRKRRQDRDLAWTLILTPYKGASDRDQTGWTSSPPNPPSRNAPPQVPLAPGVP